MSSSRDQSLILRHLQIIYIFHLTLLKSIYVVTVVKKSSRCFCCNSKWGRLYSLTPPVYAHKCKHSNNSINCNRALLNTWLWLCCVNLLALKLSVNLYVLWAVANLLFYLLSTSLFALLIFVQSILCLWVPVFIPLFHALKIWNINVIWG